MHETESASLVKTRGEQVNTDADDVSDALRRDAGEIDYIDPGKEEHQPPPRKRQHTAPTKEVTRKKQRQSKQGGLDGLINMPIEIFVEVASHLHPADILSLARSSKFLRNFLMNRSAIYIWHRAMRNVKGLPPCPPEINEPYYVSVLFSKTCSICGVPTRVSIDPVLLVRLCGSCQRTHLISLKDEHTLLPFMALRSTHVMRVNRNPSIEYALRDQFEQLRDEYEEKRRSNDMNALQAWRAEKRDIVKRREDLATNIIRFFTTVRSYDEQKVENTKTTRHLEIARRLEEIGWSEEDMMFDQWSPIRREWCNLLRGSRPLTDRVWAKLQPKLITLLVKNREERLTIERDERKDARRSLLFDLLIHIKTNSHPAITLKAYSPIAPFSSTMPTVDFTHQRPFPSFNHILDWPIVKALYETDLTEEEMEEQLDEHEGEIEALVAAWVGRIQTHFVNQLRNGYINQAQTLRPAITMHDIGQPADIPNDLKYLLRADSFFCRIPFHDSGSLPEFLTYDTFIAIERFRFDPNYITPEPWSAPNLENIVWFPYAHSIAQELLSSMGRPDATYLEMKSVGPRFACGRCYETGRNWDEMVQHYMKQRNKHAIIQKNSPYISLGVVHKGVHSLTLFPNQPMVISCASEIMTSGRNIKESRLQVCNMCRMVSGAEVVFTSLPAILNHLLDVHGIFGPDVDYHYSVLPNE